jgi:hypothetical protein
LGSSRRCIIYAAGNRVKITHHLIGVSNLSIGQNVRHNALRKHTGAAHQEEADRRKQRRFNLRAHRFTSIPVGEKIQLLVALKKGLRTKLREEAIAARNCDKVVDFSFNPTVNGQQSIPD